MSAVDFLAAAEARPGEVALVADQALFTYRTLAERVRRVMGGLIERLGLGAATPWQSACLDAFDPSAPAAVRVGLVARPDAGTVIAIHALIALGVPFVVVDPRLTPREREELVRRARLSLLLDEPLPEGAAAGDVEAPPAERCLAAVFTSGTSGTPSGVVLSGRAFSASAAAVSARLELCPADRFLLCLPPSHVGGLSIPLRCAHAGAAVVIGPPRFDPAAVVACIARDCVTVASLVPAMLERLLATGFEPPSCLRAVLLGGGHADPSLLQRAARRGIRVLTTYGLTEACSAVTIADPGEAGAGSPLAGTELRIDDGVIHVRGPTLLTRYLDDGSPLSADGWLATSDLGTIDAAGRLHVLGRRDDVIVTGGENVHPLEVERALRELPGVADACVFGVPDATYGARIAAALVPAASMTPAAIAQALRERLGPARRPRLLCFVPDLPRTRSGKIDRRRLATAAAPHLRPI